MAWNVHLCASQQSWRRFPPKIYYAPQSVANVTGTAVLECRANGVPKPNITWTRKDSDKILHKGEKFHIINVAYEDAGKYVCSAKNELNIDREEVTLVVQVKPNITSNKPMDTQIAGEIGKNTSIRCVVKAIPYATIWWTRGSDSAVLNARSDRVISLNIGDSEMTLVIKVAYFGEKYYCHAKNLLGYVSQEFTIRERYQPGKENVTVANDHEKSVGKDPVVIGSSIGAILLLIILLIILLVLWKRRPTAEEEQEQEKQEQEGQEGGGEEGGEEGEEEGEGEVEEEVEEEEEEEEEEEYTVGKLANWEVPERCLTMDKELGAGHFGKVVKAFMKTENCTKTVAVKMLKANSDALHKKEFLAELDLMKTMKPHPNIVGLVGSCTKGDNPYIIVEYCAFGNLQELLRKSRGNQVYSNLAGGSKSLTSRDLLSFMWQVARGMGYLASLKLVHRDLATRNVLVDTGNVCKIADFGLARDIYEENQYLKTTEGELPLRWMAIESIFDGITTTESDVWSFGVLMWEIITLGAKPYPGFTREQLISNLHLGYRMPRPTYCKEELYAVICQCWQKEPSERPNFSMLCRTLNRMLAAEKVLIDLDDLDAEYINANSSGEPISSPEKSSNF